MKNLQFTKKGLLFVLVSVLSLSLPVACGDEPEPQKVTSIELNYTTLSLEVGELQTLKVVKVLPNDAADKTVTWTNSDPSVATFDVDNGTVTALRVGTTSITATAKIGGKAVTCEVSVSDSDPLTDKGLTINGVTWATRNVDKPGTFTAKPEDYGMFYQWNRKFAWPVTGDVTNWDATIPTGTTWEAVNDPCPAGWRVPTLDEIDKLLAADKVSSELTTVTGINGCRFTDKATGNSIFLPATGARDYTDGTLDSTGAIGIYWSSVQYDDRNAYCLGFFISTRSNAGREGNGRRFGLPVRCVAE